MEKIIELENGISICKVKITELTESDINARVMNKKVFDTLVKIVKKDKRLESLPYVVEDEGRLRIVSGHHRVRAANTAGLREIYILFDGNKYDKQEILTKQIYHNSLEGEDDRQVLGLIWDEIEDIRLKELTALDDSFFENIVFEKPEKEIDLGVEYKYVMLSFLKTDYEKFENVALDIYNICETAKVDSLALLPIKYYNRLEKLFRKQKKTGINNLSIGVAAMLDYIRANWDDFVIYVENWINELKGE